MGLLKITRSLSTSLINYKYSNFLTGKLVSLKSCKCESFVSNDFIGNINNQKMDIMLEKKNDLRDKNYHY